jgi:hypothetical protein
MKTTIFVLLILLFQFQVFSQVRKSEISVDDLQIKVKGFKKSKNYIIKYDKFKDLTIVQGKETLAKGGLLGSSLSKDTFYCLSGFVFSGQKFSKPTKTFFLSIVDTINISPLFNNDSNLILLIDNERFVIGEGKRETEVIAGLTGAIGISSGLGNSSTTKTLNYILGKEIFEKMASSKSIELQIGSGEAKFKSEVIEMFKNIYDLSQKD